MSLYV